MKVLKAFHRAGVAQAALRTSKASLVFLVTDFWAAAKQSFDTEVLHGVNMIDAVAAVDPSIFLLYTSVGDADVVGECEALPLEGKVEAHLAATLDALEMLRPSASSIISMRRANSTR